MRSVPDRIAGRASGIFFYDLALWFDRLVYRPKTEPVDLRKLCSGGERIRDEKPAGPVPRQGRTILCVSLVRIRISVVATTLRPDRPAGLAGASLA